MELVILIGIQASGKSTFYKERFFNTHMRISMDLLNTRNKEQKFLDMCFSIQQRIVIDNTNPTKHERGKYIQMAKENNYRITGYYFQSKLENSIKRNKERKGKERIPDIGIKATYSKLELPTFDEDFDELYYVEINDNNFKIMEWRNEI